MNEEVQAMVDAIHKAHTFFYIVTDAHGHFVSANQLYTERFLPPDLPLTSLNSSFDVHEDDLPPAFEIAQQCMEQPGVSRELYMRKWDRAGKLVYTRWVITAIQRGNQLPEIICVGFEVSPGEMENELLETATAKLRALVNSSTDQNLLLTTNGVLLGFNHTAQQMIRQHNGLELITGSNFFDYLQNPEFAASFTAAFNDAVVGLASKFEHCYFPDEVAKTQWFLVDLKPIYGVDKRIHSVSVNIHNITLLKQREQEVDRQNQYLKEIAQLQSHYIRRPVANILSLIHLLKAEVTTEAGVEYLDLLEKSAVETDQIIKEVVNKTVQARRKPSEPA